MSIASILDFFNLIDRAEGAASRAKYKTLGWTFHIPRNCGYRGGDIEFFLLNFGVVIFERRVTSDEWIFSVKTRQARWAEYLLHRHGIPVTTQPFDPKNRFWGGRYPPGSQPGDGLKPNDRAWREG